MSKASLNIIVQTPGLAPAVEVMYRQDYDTRRTKSQNWNVSRQVLHLSLPNQTQTQTDRQTQTLFIQHKYSKHI